MIVCSCRGISDNDYDTYEDLLARLKQEDHKCATCLNPESIKSYKEKYERLQKIAKEIT